MTRAFANCPPQHCKSVVGSIPPPPAVRITSQFVVGPLSNLSLRAWSFHPRSFVLCSSSFCFLMHQQRERQRESGFGWCLHNSTLPSLFPCCPASLLLCWIVDTYLNKSRPDGTYFALPSQVSKQFPLFPPECY